MDLKKIGLDPRRVGQEVELDVKGQRKRVLGDMREHYHKFWFVDEPDVIFEDNDIVEAFEEDQGKRQNRESATKPSRLFIIESIFIAHERKFVEGWWLSTENSKLVEEKPGPCQILCRQVVRKPAEYRVPETIGSMKKAREKYDKSGEAKNKEKEKDKEATTTSNKKKNLKMPDFSKPSRFVDGLPRKGKKGKDDPPANSVNGGASLPNASLPPPVSIFGKLTQAGWNVIHLVITGPTAYCCGARNKTGRSDHSDEKESQQAPYPEESDAI
eukprot:PhF_6_TR39599/c0_g1_i1/m.58678